MSPLLFRLNIEFIVGYARRNKVKRNTEIVCRWLTADNDDEGHQAVPLTSIHQRAFSITIFFLLWQLFAQRDWYQNQNVRELSMLIATGNAFGCFRSSSWFFHKNSCKRVAGKFSHVTMLASYAQFQNSFMNIALMRTKFLHRAHGDLRSRLFLVTFPVKTVDSRGLPRSWCCSGGMRCRLPRALKLDRVSSRSSSD